MNNRQWLNGVLLMCCFPITSISANPYSNYPHSQQGALAWWPEQNQLVTGSVSREWQPPAYPVTAAYQPAQRSASNAFHSYAPTIASDQIYFPAGYQQPHSLPLPNPTIAARHASHNCTNLQQVAYPGRCILPSSQNARGLQEQIRYLERTDPTKTVGNKWVNVSNADLLITAKTLLNREKGYHQPALQQQFSLLKVGSHQNADKSYYTGYFTPELQISANYSHEYRYPIYARPRNGTRLSRKQIDFGGLKNQGLEIAWTNDLVNLYFAHIQGSAIARYPDGTMQYLNYAGNNGHTHQKLSRYLSQSGYVNSSLSNANVRTWLKQYPEKTYEVLHKNPRYIFFSLTHNKTSTATGTVVIPGHTVAVDDNYIPLGAVLLAEIPRINHRGEKTGSDWRMLFAQDRGAAIKGPGRFDIYTGPGSAAEQHTYQLTGLHQTYLLLSKQQQNGHYVAGM